MNDTDIPDHDLAEMERLAFDLAALRGARVMAGLGRTLSVRYKHEDEAAFRDPVSEIDEEVERLIRERVGERFPGHDILGEEDKARPGRGHDFVWAVDPVDGTTNFVNGFPLFACSIGVLRRGRPVAGAVWCSTTHALRPGVYHARLGGTLSFDSENLGRTPNPAVRRRLSGLGSLEFGKSRDWEIRKTGSAALECAFVAAGLLNVARFDSPHVWDVAGGLALVRAAGGTAYVRRGKRWAEFISFHREDDESDDIGDWRAPIIIGEPAAAAALREASAHGGSRPDGNARMPECHDKR